MSPCSSNWLYDLCSSVNIVEPYCTLIHIISKAFEQIKKEFFDDLKNYNEILKSRNERDRLESEINNLEMQLIKEK